MRLQEKIALTRVHTDLAGFLAAWLSDRELQVVVGGAASAAEVLADSVFQGTVIDPPPWNAFFSDSWRALIHKDFKEIVFADDLNAWRAFSLDKRASAPHETALSELVAVQRELHQWGAANQVDFDPNKESVHILHRSCYYGEKLLRSWGVSLTRSYACLMPPSMLQGKQAGGLRPYCAPGNSSRRLN